jgi:hypothetical protein
MSGIVISRIGQFVGRGIEMLAIVTKYIGPTDAHGARIKATTEAGSITIEYPHELSGDDVYAKAAMALVRKLGWDNNYYGPWIAANLPKQSGVVFVNYPDRSRKYMYDFGQE